MPAPRQSSSGSMLPTVVPKRVDNAMSVNRYYRSADLLLRQASSYRAEHNDLQLYTMLLRLVSLVVETVPNHKDFKRKAPEYQKLYKDISSKYMAELEQLKMSLKFTLGEDQSSWLQQGAIVHTPDTIQISTSNLPQLDWAAYGTSTSPTAQPAAEIKPAPSGSLSTIDAGVDLMTRDQSTNATSPSNGSYASLPSFKTNLRTASQATRDRHALLPTATSTRRHSASGQGTGIGYPSFDSSPYQAIDYGFGQARQSSADVGQDLSLQMANMEVGRAYQNGAASLMDAEAVPRPPPRLGPQEIEVQSVSGPVGVPGPDDTCCQPAGPPPPPPDEQPGDIPKKHGIREVHVSMGLMEEFLAYARSNTRQNVESCGILAGVLDTKQGLFNITTLIVPKQEGTSDTVQALAEEEIFEAQDTRGLYPMGWIHTHPSQTCFLSSIDVHTQCGYQTMLDEAIAIVMAPSDRSKKCGIFRLSTPGGLKLVQKCNLRGFHAHPTPDSGQQIYELCGHVFLNERIKHEVIDLR